MALGQIATQTPVLFVGGGDAAAADERLRADLGERLQRLGQKGSAASLAGEVCRVQEVDLKCFGWSCCPCPILKFLHALSPCCAAVLLNALGKLSFGLVAPASSASRNAHLLALGALNQCLVAEAPLPEAEEMPPIAGLLAQLQVGPISNDPNKNCDCVAEQCNITLVPWHLVTADCLGHRIGCKLM